MSSIIAPAVCGAFGIIIINSGLLYIRCAFTSSKNNPTALSVEGEQEALSKIEKRLAVRFIIVSAVCDGWNSTFLANTLRMFLNPNLLFCFVQVLRRLNGSVMFFGCFAWNGVNFMYKSQVRQGSVYVGAMALRCNVKH